MIRLPGERGKDLCDNHLGMTRRDILRVGGSGMLGLSLGGMLDLNLEQSEGSEVDSLGKSGGGHLRVKSLCVSRHSGKYHRLD